MAQVLFAISGFFEPSSLPIRVLGILASLGSVYFLVRILQCFKIPPAYGCLMAHTIISCGDNSDRPRNVFGVLFLMMSFLFVTVSSEKIGALFMGVAILAN